MIYASEDGFPIYKDNGIQLWRVQFPEEVSESSAINVDLQLGKTELFPLKEQCGVTGRKTKVYGMVNGTIMTEGTYCLEDGAVASGWNRQFDIPWPSDAGYDVHDIELHFRQPGSNDIQFEEAWRDMPESSITFSAEQVPEGEEPPPGAGEECNVVLGKDPCPDGYVCYEGVCTPVEDVPDDGGGDNGDGGDDPPDDGSGGDGSSGISGQTMLAGLLGAGLWARHRRDGK